MSVKFISDREVFDYFKQRIKEELFTHPVITNNVYCKWFADATLTKSDVIFFTKQLSVFSNQFTIANITLELIEYPQNTHLSNKYILKKLSQFWKEDMPNGDITTISTIPKDINIKAEIQVVEKLIFVGTRIIPLCFGDDCQVEIQYKDGEKNGLECF